MTYAAYVRFSVLKSTRFMERRRPVKCLVK